MLNTVKVSKEFESLFEKAQEYVGKYFKEMKQDETKGTIEIFSQRYILVRAAAMSVEFFEIIKDLYKEAGEDEANKIARSLLFDLAHAIGKADAKNFHEKMGLKDPIAKLSAGPVHLAYTGWAFVDIFPESKPSPDENYYLIYDHPQAFEADSWKAAGKKSDFPICVMNSGYSSGWCEESFGITLVASEILCRAKGDDCCRFIMAHPLKIEGYIKDYLAQNPELSKQASKYEIPGFFAERRRAEEKTKEAEQKFRTIFDGAFDGMLLADLKGKKFVDGNRAICEMLGYSPEEIISLGVEDIHPEKDLPFVIEQFEKQARREIAVAGSLPVKRKDGTVFYADVSSALINISGKDYLLGLFHDITKRKRAELELERKVKELKEFYDLAIGRENKMIDLEKEIDSLRKELGRSPKYKQ
jgi:PAS domain S-box-containing protein